MPTDALISNDDVRRLLSGRDNGATRPVWLPYNPAENPTDGTSALLPGLSEHVTLDSELRTLGWRTRNRCDIVTGHTTFDRAADLVKPGNRIGNVMVGFYVRPYNETKMPNGEPCQPGRMQDFDLAPQYGMPDDVEAFIREHGRDRTLWVGNLYHPTPGGSVEHGWIVTWADTHEFLHAWRTGPTRRSQLVLDACAPYLAVAPRT